MIRDPSRPGDLRPVSDSLGQLTRRLRMGSPDDLAAVFAHWDEVVGEHLALHVRPQVLQDGVLSVTVDDPSWATQMRFLHDDIVAAVNARAGRSIVERLAVRVAGSTNNSASRQGNSGRVRRNSSDPQW